MTLIISSMCPRCKSWQRLKSGDGKCKGCGYNFYDGNIYASAFQETDTTMKRHCKKCDHNSYFLPDGNCPNCTHNDNQGRVAWDRVLTQKEIEIFMNQTPEEMRIRLGQKAKDFVAANDAIRFPPMSVDTLNTPAAELRESFPDTHKMALYYFIEGQKFNARDPSITDWKTGQNMAQAEMIMSKTRDLNRCPGCLGFVFPKGKCPNPKCDFDFDAYVAKHGAFPAYDHNKGGWKFRQTMAYGKRAFDANVVINDMAKKCKLPKIHARIEELKAMRHEMRDKAYVINDPVAIPSIEDLDKLNHYLQKNYPSELDGDLLIYPSYRPDKIRLEWQFKNDDISIDVNLSTWDGYYHYLSKPYGGTTDKIVNLTDKSDWENVVWTIKEIKRVEEYDRINR